MKKIVIKAKEYPCRITMGAMLRFKRETGHDVSEMKSTDIADMICFMWCCCASACNADGVEFGMSLDDFADSIEGEELQKFSAGLMEEGGEQKKTRNARRK